MTSLLFDRRLSNMRTSTMMKNMKMNRLLQRPLRQRHLLKRSLKRLVQRQAQQQQQQRQQPLNLPHYLLAERRDFRVEQSCSATGLEMMVKWMKFWDCWTSTRETCVKDAQGRQTTRGDIFASTPTISSSLLGFRAAIWTRAGTALRSRITLSISNGKPDRKCCYCDNAVGIL